MSGRGAPENGRCEMRRFLASLGIFTVLVAAVAFAQASGGGRRWTPPRTPWGEPDLQGKWSYATITPLERPADLASKEVLSREEVSALDAEAQTGADRRDGGAEA